MPNLMIAALRGSYAQLGVNCLSAANFLPIFTFKNEKSGEGKITPNLVLTAPLGKLPPFFRVKSRETRGVGKVRLRSISC